MKTNLLLLALVFTGAAAFGQSVTRSTAPAQTPSQGGATGAEYAQVQMAPNAAINAGNTGNGRRAARQMRRAARAEYVAVSLAPRR